MSEVYFKKRVMEPVVVYISGKPGDGKSTIGKLVDEKQIPVFHTDVFFNNLKKSCPSILRQIVDEHDLIDDIDMFLNEVVEKNQVIFLMRMLLNKWDEWFNPTDFISVIEGYLPNHMSKLLLHGLKEKGYRVWEMKRDY